MKFAILAALIALACAYSDEEIVQNAKIQMILKHRTPFPTTLGKPTVPTSADFEAFIKVYGKKYADEAEKAKRFGIYQTNLVIAQALTATDEGTAKYGVTKFADMTHDEFKIYHNLDMRAASVPFEQAEIPSGEPPQSVDWRKKGAVTYVKNQGQCGSCWSFSTTGNVEGQWFLKRGQLIALSEAELVDCDKVDSGCEGGLMTQAYKAIMKLGGLESEKEYPYEPRDGRCRFNKSEVVATIDGSVVLPKNETQLASWCATNGPIANGINADVMQLYQGGVSHPKKYQCDPQQLDHGVLIVGYGVEGRTPFWIIKNSWGADWGEQGYYRVFRGAGVCGLNQMCSSSKVAAK